MLFETLILGFGIFIAIRIAGRNKYLKPKGDTTRVVTTVRTKVVSTYTLDFTKILWSSDYLQECGKYFSTVLYQVCKELDPTGKPSATVYLDGCGLMLLKYCNIYKTAGTGYYKLYVRGLGTCTIQILPKVHSSKFINFGEVHAYQNGGRDHVIFLVAKYGIQFGAAFPMDMWDRFKMETCKMSEQFDNLLSSITNNDPPKDPS
jgi:hypothetical protein